MNHGTDSRPVDEHQQAILGNVRDFTSPKLDCHRCAVKQTQTTVTHKTKLRSLGTLAGHFVKVKADPTPSGDNLSCSAKIAQPQGTKSGRRRTFGHRMLVACTKQTCLLPHVTHQLAFPHHPEYHLLQIVFLSLTLFRKWLCTQDT